MVDIKEIIDDVKKYFSEKHFKVISYTDNTIICESYDFDLRIIDYIEEVFNVKVDYEFGIDEKIIKIGDMKKENKNMIELYLDNDIREQLLNYDIEHSENCYDRNMYYITTSESQILYDIIYGYDKELLEKVGFKPQDIEIILEDDMNVKFTNKKNYYIKQIA